MACQEALDRLKQALSSPPILSYPHFDVPFTVFTDASYWAVSAVFAQIQDGEELVVAYYSQQLSEQEQNYSTTEREALAVVAAVKKFYPYLYGREFQLVTDHNPLVTLTNLKDVTGRLARWIMYLQQFNYSFIHRSGKSHANADSLSRSTPPQLIVSLVNTLPQVDVQAYQLEDPEINYNIEALGRNLPVHNHYKHQTSRLVVQDGVLYRRLKYSQDEPDLWQLVIPQSLRYPFFSAAASRIWPFWIQQNF